jgi:hypothetical protein
VDNSIQSANSFNFFGATSFDETVKPNAEFTSYLLNTQSEYMFSGNANERESLRTVGMQTVEMEDTDSIPAFPAFSHGGNSSGGSGDGSNWVNCTITEGWDGTVSGGGGSRWNGDIETSPLDIPSGYAVRIFWNGELKETLILKGVSPNGTAADG